jgi:cytochrome b subunit of formate dehydrogenase
MEKISIKMSSCFVLLFLLIFFGSQLQAENNEVCLDCHEGDEVPTHIFEPDTIGWDYRHDPEADPNEIDLPSFEKAVHGKLQCTECHTNATENHDEDEIVINKVECQSCHKDEYKEYRKTVHGEAMFKRKDRFAPDCTSCHGHHYIYPPSDKNSSVYVLNIPETCGRCHREGTAMTETHDISQIAVVENYSMSIHGKALFKQGLTVAPTCTTCHGKHDILKHEDAKSKINEANVAKTCTECHSLIEQTHQKIVKGRLWEKIPGQLPPCVECHSPHNLRQAIYDKTITDRMCLECHTNPKLKPIEAQRSKSLYMEKGQHENSVHNEVPCVKCHYDIHPESDKTCKEIDIFNQYLDSGGKNKDLYCNDLKPVKCESCHEDEVAAYDASIHGKLVAEKDGDAPDCVYCHGKHDVLSKNSLQSPTFPRNVPELCGNCHKDGGQSAIRGKAHETAINMNYTESTHGKALLDSGLLVSATCVNCHTPHKILPADNTESSINHENLPETCANCHLGIYENFKSSIHSPLVTQTDKKLPACNDCHYSHTINRHDASQFRLKIVDQCGKCHEDMLPSYFETYHGKASKLGEGATANCADCHGSHGIYNQDNPQSTLHQNNKKETCSKCHTGVNDAFTDYLPHASHNDRENYPWLFYTFWSMTSLLLGTFALFGLHTLLWFIRLSIDIVKNGTNNNKHLHEKEKHYRRFDVTHTVLHLLIIVSFLTLALTGMTLKFTENNFLMAISQFLGGPIITGYLHRIGAVITFFYFSYHLFRLFALFSNRKITVKGLFTEEYSMLPLPRDFKELVQNVKYFLGKGDPPEFGRWTYWEKFDYMAVFWGVAVIGLTGLILWFPEAATIILPGWAINVAAIIHSDEALLAAGFIFTIHFFNTHLRPGKFPMDTVIFTQKVPLSEFKEERPREYQQMVSSGQLENKLENPPSKKHLFYSKLFGFIFLTIGIVIVAAILYSVIFT